MITPATTRKKTAGEQCVQRRQRSSRASFVRTSTGPMPPRIIDAFRKASTGAQAGQNHVADDAHDQRNEQQRQRHERVATRRGGGTSAAKSGAGRTTRT